MLLKKRFFSDEAGASLLLIALCIPLLLTVVGITVDLGRMYAARSKAQQALDAGLLGAVATASTTPVAAEALQLFNANYPPGYMGTTVSNFAVAPPDGGIYNGSLTLRVPFTLMQLFGYANTDLPIISQVTNAQTSVFQELSLVVDNGSIMDVSALRTSLSAFITSIFAGNATLPSTTISVVPFNAAVNVGSVPIARLGWSQNSVLELLYSGIGNNGYLSNRNPDMPTNASFVDVSDIPPGVGLTTRFRSPYGFWPGLYFNGDGVSLSLTNMLFASNSQSEINSTLTSMAGGGSTRVNVGLMWGWFALSPNWTGRWDAGKPTLPLATAANHVKSIILIVGSRNSIYLGGSTICGVLPCALSDDDATTLSMCAAIKATGIHIYAIGYGSSSGYGYRAGQMSTCSSGAGYNFTAANGAALTTVLQQISDSLTYNNIRLTQ